MANGAYSTIAGAVRCAGEMSHAISIAAVVTNVLQEIIWRLRAADEGGPSLRLGFFLRNGTPNHIAYIMATTGTPHQFQRARSAAAMPKKPRQRHVSDNPP